MKKILTTITRRRDEKGNLINRGVAFSFKAFGNYKIGNYYRAIASVKSKKIFICHTEEHAYGISNKISKKAYAKGKKPLIDIRKKEVRALYKDVEVIDVFVKGNIIVAEGYVATDKKDISNSKTNTLAEAANIDLSSMKKVVSLKFTKKALKKAVGDLWNYYEDENGEIVMNVVSWFSGAGMLDYAFVSGKEPSPELPGTIKTNKNKFDKKIKFDVIYGLEYDKSACETYKTNIGNHIVHGDVKEADPNDIPDADVFLAGVSCKPFSNVNRTLRLENHGDIDLLETTLKFIKAKQFPVFCLENVPQILTASGAGYFNMISEYCPNYKIEAKVFEDYEYGGYTTRKRAIIIGSRIGDPDFSAVQKKQGGTVGQALAKIDSSWKNLTDNDITFSSEETALRMSHVPQGGNWRNIPEELMNPGMLKTVKYEQALAKFTEECGGDKDKIKAWTKEHKSEKGGTQSNMYLRLDENKPGPTLTNFRKTLLTHPTRNTSIYISEASAISGFDKDFVFKGTVNDKQQQIGNGVPFALGCVAKTVIEDIYIRHLNEVKNKATKIVEAVEIKAAEMVKVVEVKTSNAIKFMLNDEVELTAQENGQLGFVF